MANEKTPVVWDDDTKKHRPLGTGEKMGGLDASSLLSSDSGNLLEAGSDGLAYLSGSGMVDPRADNLLEDSANGKLQVTIDRIAEWLDGHPQDAAAIAEAISVVSGDEGNVVTAGSDKGAFLSKGAIAAAVAGMSAAQLQTLVASFADGETIVASGGKLVVDPSTAPKAKLQKISAALAKSGAGLSVDSGTGKLVVDFASMDPSIMRNVVLSMVQTGGGIGVDSNGQLFVDFENMPTDKFEAMLASLHMQIPLEADLSLYVNNRAANAGDTIIDGRGTAAKPFRTIQACVSWAASYYSLGPYNITIIVQPGDDYRESLVLPSYNASSGVFKIISGVQATPPVVLVAGGAGACCRVSGGTWYLQRLRFVNNPSLEGVSHVSYPLCLNSLDYSVVQVYGCEFDMSYYGAATTLLHMTVVASSSNSRLTFHPFAGYPSKLNYHKGNSNLLYVITTGSGGSMTFAGAYGDRAYAVPCSGDATTFAYAAESSSMRAGGSGDDYIHFVVADGGSCTGKRYDIQNGANIRAPYGGFPGDEAGTVESSTYCWYEQQSNP